MTLTKALLLTALVVSLGAIFAPQLPGAWWQWTATAAILIFAAAAAGEDDR